MAGEDEIIQKFRVQDDGAVQTLTNIDKQMQNVRTTTANLNSTVKEHGGSITQLGEKMVGLGERHMNARHAIMLFSESTGVARGGIMTMVQSMMMMGAPIGAAVGGFILFKQHLEAVAEEAKKTAEKIKNMHEEVMNFENRRTEKSKEYEFGGEGAGFEEQKKRIAKEMEAKQDAMRKLSKANYMWPVERETGQAVFGTNEEHHNAVAQYAALNSEVETLAVQMANAGKYAEIYKKHQDEINELDQQALLLKAQKAVSGTSDERTLEINESLADIDKNRAMALIALNEALEKSSATEAERFVVQTKAKEESIKALESIKQNKDAVARQAQELYQKQQATAILTFRNQGDTHNAEFMQLQAHLSAQLEAHKNNKKMQAEDTNDFNAQYAALTKKEHDENRDLDAQLNETIYNARGDKYDAEKTQLQNWYDKEIEMHKDQKAKIDAMYGIKIADLQRRRGQDFADKSQGYQNAITSATQGSMMAQIQNLTYEHNKAQSEYKREGTPEAKRLAELEDQAYKAKIHEMKIESNAKQQGHVGFMDAGGAWEAFSASLNKNPMEALHLQEEKMTNALLNKIDGDLQKNEKSSKAVAGAGAQAVAAHTDALAAAMDGTAAPDAATATASGKADSPSKKWINKDGLLWKAQEKAIKDKEEADNDHPKYDTSGRLISGTPKPYHTTHTVDEAHGFKRMNMSDLMDAANLQEAKTTNQILKEMNDKFTGAPVLVG